MSVAHTWGTTAAERALAYPCDTLVERFDLACWRGVTVRAEPAPLFRWLCQLKVAPYSYDWIDNRGRRSPRTLTPGAERLTIREPVMSIFRLASFEEGRHLTLTTQRFASALFPCVAVSYVLRPAGAGETRLLAKLVSEARPGRIGALAASALAWGDLVMMRKQLLTLKALAERSARGGVGTPG